MRRPFSVFKERTSSGLFWYVRFWSVTANKYVWHRSLGIPVEGKRERRREAEETAQKMLNSFIRKRV